MKNFMNKIRGIFEMLHFDNAFEIILDRILYHRAKLMIYRIGNFEIPVDRSGGDLQSIRTCLAGPMYRTLLSGLDLKNLINVLDLGAHVGGFGLLVADMGFQINRLVAVELNPNTSLRLLYNLKTNLFSPTKVTVLNLGVSGSDGVFKSAFGRGNSSDSIRSTKGASQSAISEVLLKTIDNIIEMEFKNEVIDLCKIDIEGAEYDVLEKGALSLKKARYVIIEVHQIDKKDPKIVIKELGQLGFQLLTENSKEHVFLLKNLAL